MSTDYRALCAELAQVLAEEYGVQRDFDSGEPLLGSGAIELLSRARTALAQPEPEGVTDGELLRCYGLAKRDHCYEGPMDDWPKRAERAATVHGLRAVLTHYTRPTTEPVPVAERPWEREGWCNSDNEAFFFDSDTKKWSLCECDKYSPVMTNASDRYTHSLPHHALPVPTPTP
jgi:hypothetical protein